MTEFVLTDPDELTPKALEYLASSLARTPDNDMTLREVLDQARANEGSIFTIKSTEVIGAFYIQLFPNLLSMVLLAGDGIDGWKDELTNFLTNTARERGIKHVCALGRPGWNRIFKKLRPIGTFYIFDV